METDARLKDQILNRTEPLNKYPQSGCIDALGRVAELEEELVEVTTKYKRCLSLAADYAIEWAKMEAIVEHFTEECDPCQDGMIDMGCGPDDDTSVSDMPCTNPNCFQGRVARRL